MRSLKLFIPLLLGAFSFFSPAQEGAAPRPAALRVDDLGREFQFVAFGDTRFTDPANTDVSASDVRRDIVKGIASEKPAFVTIGGDLTYKGAVLQDWEVFDRETALWRDRGIPVFPALGNHELMGKKKSKDDKSKNPQDEMEGLANYFARFPQLKQSRYCSMRAGSLLFLFMDSNPRGILKDEKGKEMDQGIWLQAQLDNLDPEIEFVLVVTHHPPYSSSKMAEVDDPMATNPETTKRKAKFGGHDVRPSDRALGEYLEHVQNRKGFHAAIVVLGSHVHNYERQVHGGITFITTGGGGAEPVYFPPQPTDLFKGTGKINYHYLLVRAQPGTLDFTMKRLDPEVEDAWTEADHFTVTHGKARLKAKSKR